MANTFKADLEYGQLGEKFVSQLGSDVSIEVKRDRKWYTTGNIFIEFSCSGKPSGIMSTEALYFAYLLSKDDIQIAMYMWLSSGLRQALPLAKDANICRVIKGGDRFAVEGYLVPLTNIGELTKLCH